MKLSQLTSFLSLIVLLFHSCSDDLTSYNVVDENAIFIDNDQTMYQKGDLLWLNINIPKEQIDAKTGKTIDIYELTEVYDALFTFSLFSIKDAEVSRVVLDIKNIEVNKGGIYIQDEVKLGISAGYDYYNDVYDVRVGITLIEIGEFYIANGLSEIGKFEMSFTSENHDVLYSTTIKNSDAEGRFHLTVSE